MHELITNLWLLAELLLKLSITTGAILSVPAICFLEWWQRRKQKLTAVSPKMNCVGEREWRTRKVA